MPDILWERTFDNSPRHCWPLRDGGRVLEGSLDARCKLNHAADPQLVGKVAWQRFIRAAVTGARAAGLASPFTGEDLEISLSGKSPSLETYSRLGRTIATILVDSGSRTARVQLCDPAYAAIFAAASAEVDRQYAAREF